jgi:hypothetical protein
MHFNFNLNLLDIFSGYALASRDQYFSSLGLVKPHGAIRGLYYYIYHFTMCPKEMVYFVFSRRLSSKLVIKKAKEQDAGLYECLAENVIGKSERANLSVIVRSCKQNKL